MNIIQKAWLKVLGPIIPFVNEKLAKRSGLLGKFGRFFAIGPRQFGYHPFNRVVRYYNRYVMTGFAYMFHRYSFWKSATGRGYHMLRPHRMTAFLLPLYALGVFFYIPRVFGIIRNQEGTDLQWLSEQEGQMVPSSALNFRTSAHFTEINSIYGLEMAKRYSNIEKELLKEYTNASEEERKTRYARKGYKYIVPSSSPDNA